MPEQDLQIKRSAPQGEAHAFAHQGMLDMISVQNKSKQEIIPLVEYLQEIAGKPRGSATGGKEDLNSHAEQFIIKEGEEIRLSSLAELQTLLSGQGLSVEILGVQSIGNPNQRVKAVVQGVNRDNPKSGFERPVVAEGPHMILAPYAIDKRGKLHLFRTIQMRTGEAVIDTPRGFAEAKQLEDGEQMYDDIEKNSEKITGNMKRIVSEESGDALQIKKVVYLGSPRVNSSFVTSKSAIFGVEVDYDAFVKNKKIVTEAELQRRREQFEHEGLVGDVLDFTLSEYINYKRDSELTKDMAADFGTDTVVMDFLARNLQNSRRILSAEGKANRQFKEEDPEGYLKHRLRVAVANHPENAALYKERVEKYLSKLYRPALKPKNPYQ